MSEDDDRAQRALICIIIGLGSVLGLIGATTYSCGHANELRAKCLQEGHSAEDCAKTVRG